MKKVINQLENNFKLNKIQNSEFDKFKFSVMKVESESYDIEGIGHVSYLNSKALFGLMRIESIIINPIQVDASLFSIEYMKIINNKTTIIEQYDTLLNSERKEDEFINIRNKYKDYEKINEDKHWYDDLLYKSSFRIATNKKNDDVSENCINECVSVYIEQLKNSDKCDIDLKKQKTHKYSDGLIENGGPSTDVFNKGIGQEKTKEFFNKVVFFNE